MSGQSHHHAPIQRPTDDSAFDPIGDLGECADVYEEMQLCLADNKRDWVACQGAVKAVKECLAKQHAAASEQPASKNKEG